MLYTTVGDISLFHGDSFSCLHDCKPDTLITDPPFSKRTHSGHDKGRGKGKRRRLEYDYWTASQARAFVEFWSDRVVGWFVVITDTVLAPAFERAFARAGRYTFAPLPFVARGSRVRLSGDGPSCWTSQIVVARPRTKRFATWGTLDGAYILPEGQTERSMVRVGGKPEWLMRALVRDYSLPGDLVCDPLAGGGTTLLAAASEGRRAIGAELDERMYLLAAERLRSYTPALFVERPAANVPAQYDLFDDSP